MNTEEVVVKPLPPLLVAELSAVAEDYEPSSIGPVLTPLYPELFRRVAEAEVPMVGAPLAYYEPVPDDDAVVCHAAVPVREVPEGNPGLAFVELPGIEQAATLIHHGPMDEADEARVMAEYYAELDALAAAGPTVDDDLPF